MVSVKVSDDLHFVIREMRTSFMVDTITTMFRKASMPPPASDII